MSQKVIWTAARDAQLRRLRGDGATWDGIAVTLHVSRNAAIERGQRIGARVSRSPSPFDPVDDPLDPGREPLPSGHPITWDAITAGTCCAGLPYPWPPLTDSV